MIDVSKGPLRLHQPVTAEQQDKKLKEVAELYEKQFLREMLKAMRSTVQESGFVKTSQAETIFREQLDHEYVEKWGDKGGIGLADMIHQQLLSKYGAQLGITPQEIRPQGPLQLRAKDNLSASPFASKAGPLAPPSAAVSASAAGPLQKSERPELKTAGPQTPLLMKLPVDENSSRVVTNPWSGKYLGSFQLNENPENQTLLIAHDNGLKSTIHYQGLSKPPPVGQKIEAGQVLGELSPASQMLSWKVEDSAERGAE